MRTDIKWLQLLVILFCCSGEVVTAEEVWLGNYAGDRIPLRETLDSRYVVVSVTGSQIELNDRMFVANRQLRYACLKEGGHGLINIHPSVTIADVASTVEKGVIFEKGVLVVLTADCVTKSRLLDSEHHVLR
mgnify:CR=1 FL=1